MWSLNGRGVCALRLLWKELINFLLIIGMYVVASFLTVIRNILDFIVRCIHIGVGNDYNLGITYTFNCTNNFTLFI